MKSFKPQINWVYKIAEMFDEAHVSVDGDLNLEVIPDYFEALVSLLDETSKRTIGEFRKQCYVNNEMFYLHMRLYI